MLRIGAGIYKQRLLGAGHECLAAKLRKPGEQSGAAVRIEMGGDLVEQQDRRHAADLRHQAGMGEDEADQQRLLLAGGRLRRRRRLFGKDHRKIAAMRSLERPPGGAVAGAGLRQGIAIGVLALARRAAEIAGFEIAGKSQRGKRKAGAVDRLAGNAVGQKSDRLGAGDGDSERLFGKLRLDGVKQCRFAIFIEQPVAARQQLFQIGNAAAMKYALA